MKWKNREGAVFSEFGEPEKAPTGKKVYITAMGYNSRLIWTTIYKTKQHGKDRKTSVR